MRAPFMSSRPKGFHLELSRFNSLWSLLSTWVSTATVDYFCRPDAAREDAVAVPMPSDQSAQTMGALYTVLVDRAVPEVVEALGLRVPVDDLGRRLAAVLCTMR